jgi:hypothetical protein
VEFMVDQVSLGQVFSEFFGFSHQYHSTAVHIHLYINWGWTVGLLSASVTYRHSFPFCSSNSKKLCQQKGNVRDKPLIFKLSFKR